MRTGRGLLATFGASISLIAAGSIALLGLSALVAFNGWPDISAGPASARATTLASVIAQDGASSSTGSGQIELAAAAPRAERTTATGSGGKTATKHLKAASDPSSLLPQRAASAGASLEADPSGTPEPKQPEENPGDGVREATGAVGDGTSQTTSRLGETVTPVSPELAKSVDDIGRVLDETLTDVGQSVGEIVDLVGGK